MLNELLKYIAVYLTSMLKFIGGPLLGIGSGLPFWTTAILTCLGMMTSVFIFSTVVGKGFKAWVSSTFYRNKKLFSAKNRKLVKVWRNYGLKGVAFLTPVFLTPIGGTLIAASFGESRRRIFIYMFASSAFWSIVFSFALFLFKNGFIHHSSNLHF
jgi:hypothetical protein